MTCAPIHNKMIFDWKHQGGQGGAKNTTKEHFYGHDTAQTYNISYNDHVCGTSCWTRPENITQNLRPMGFILHVWPEPFLSQHPKILWQCLRNPLLNQQLYFPSVCLTETVPYFPFTFFSWSVNQRYFLLLIMTMSAELPPERAQNISHITSVPWVLSCLCRRNPS